MLNKSSVTPCQAKLINLFNMVKHKVWCNNDISSTISCGLTTIEYLLLAGLIFLVCAVTVSCIGVNSNKIFVTVNNAIGKEDHESVLPLPVPPVNPSLTGTSFAIKGVTEPVDCDTKLADTKSLNVYEYYAADQPNGTLIIYPRNGTNGMIPNTINYNGPWHDNEDDILKVFSGTGVKTNKIANGLFSNLLNCTNIDISFIDTSETESMAAIFSYCLDLTSINLSSFFDTANVTDMEGMFANNISLQSLDLSNFDTSKVTNMRRMFYNCRDSLIFLDIDNFDTSKVTNMSEMFAWCESLNSILLPVNIEQSPAVITGANTNQLDGISYMFSHTSKLNDAGQMPAWYVGTYL